MSEARFETVMRAIRDAAPVAPDRLREHVRGLREPQPRRVIRLQPALVAAVAIAIAVSLGAAAIGGLFGASEPSGQSGLSTKAGKVHRGLSAQARTVRKLLPANPYSWQSAEDKRLLSPKTSATTGGSALNSFGPSISPGSRLQRYDVSMSLRVRDLSRATQAAVRRTRRLGGYIGTADYSTGGNVGDSTLDLRVPVQHVQQAIASFSELGTILSQHISVGDLQAPLDQTDARIAAQRRILAELEKKNPRSPAEQIRLDSVKRALQRLSQSRTNLVRAGTYAKLSLQLTTRKTASKYVAPGRFDRFWGDAGDILGKEAIIVLYALVVAGPFAILAALALVAERTRRRRADHRLLGETG